MRAGSQTMQIQAGIPPELVDALQAIILLFLVVNVLRRILGRRRRGRPEAGEPVAAEAMPAAGGAE